MTRIGIILGSTRPNRVGPQVAQWVYDEALKRNDADIEYELIDVADYNLPLLDEPKQPAEGNYVHAHTINWSETISRCDGFIFVTAEYNHSIPAALKNAIDFLWVEWNNKACGFVSYGFMGGARVVEHLRTVAGQMMMADVRSQVILMFGREFDQQHNFTPNESSVKNLNSTINQVVSWTEALAPIRER